MSVYCMMFSGFPGLYPPDEVGNPAGITKIVSDIFPWGEPSHSWLRIAALSSASLLESNLEHGNKKYRATCYSRIFWTLIPATKYKNIHLSYSVSKEYFTAASYKFS